MIMMRKESKEHGTKKRIEGGYEVEEISLIIEDVVTTGSSIIETAQVNFPSFFITFLNLKYSLYFQILRAHGLIVENALVIMDREQGGKENLSTHEIKLIRYTQYFPSCKKIDA